MRELTGRKFVTQQLAKSSAPRPTAGAVGKIFQSVQDSNVAGIVAIDTPEESTPPALE